jgi:NADPH:quinone reductase
MKAIEVKQNGGPETVAYADVAAPEPGARQWQVTVETAGLNYLDINQRQGAVPAPFIAAVEGVGRVAKIGSRVQSDWLGQRVGWLSGLGSFAQIAVVDETKVVRIPDDISTDDAVALLMQGITAHYLVTSAFPIRKESTVLVHSAAGGVGRLLTQIAHHLGATVIGTASTPEKRRIATDSGADHAIEYANFAAAVAEITGGRGVDVIHDGVGRTRSLRD